MPERRLENTRKNYDKCCKYCLGELGSIHYQINDNNICDKCYDEWIERELNAKSTER